MAAKLLQSLKYAKSDDLLQYPRRCGWRPDNSVGVCFVVSEQGLH